MKYIIFRPGSNVGEVIDGKIPNTIEEERSLYPVNTLAYFCEDNVRSKWARLEKSRAGINGCVSWYWYHHYKPNEQQKLQTLLLS